MLDRRALTLSLISALTAGAAEAASKKKTAKKQAKASKKKTVKKPSAPPAPSVTTPQLRASLSAAYDAIYQDYLRASPTLVTSLGLDKDALYYQKSKLSDRGFQGKAESLALLKRSHALLLGFNRSDIFGRDRIHYDSIMWDINSQLEGAKNFSFGEVGSPTPYVLSQLSGSYQSLPDFLESQHTVKTNEDASAYVSRLKAFAKSLDQETERAKADWDKGTIPPNFVLETALLQLKGMYAKPAEQQGLVTSFIDKLKASSLSDQEAKGALEIMKNEILPAYERQIAAVSAILPKSSDLAGIKHRPQGEAYYAWAANSQTTTTMSPREIHALGLEQVAILSERIDALFKAQGLSQGTPGERMRALSSSPSQIYPNTPDGKRQLLESLNIQMKTIEKKLPDYFGVLPKAGCDIRAVPEAIEAGAPSGYYQSASLDGSRPGAYYINLRDTAGQPAWLLPTLTYHEALPGHHMQISIQQEAQDLPDLRKISGFTAYIEGWALYSEQLAEEMGMYKSDPYGRIGYLHDAIFRAVRLVVDTGMHNLGWTRAQAIAYMVDKTGDREEDVKTEIDRYCVWPGQALGYMVGRQHWLSLRERSQKKLGTRFDIKRFHDVGLLCAAVPLDVLTDVYKDAGLI